MPTHAATPPVEPPVETDLGDCVDHVLAGAWREAVLQLRDAERRRIFTPTVHLGDPHRTRTSFAVPARGPRERPLDHALSCDVVAALLDRWRRTSVEETQPSPPPGRHGPPYLWVSRSGPLERHDEDARWLAAARAAYDEVGLTLELAVVTHAGWYDPRTGAGRRWKRLRRR